MYVLTINFSFTVNLGKCDEVLSERASVSNTDTLVSQDIASQKFSMPSPVRTVIVADFDSDNELEVFFNNIAYRGSSANRLFR